MLETVWQKSPTKPNALPHI